MTTREHSMAPDAVQKLNDKWKNFGTIWTESVDSEPLSLFDSCRTLGPNLQTVKQKISFCLSRPNLIQATWPQIALHVLLLPSQGAVPITFGIVVIVTVPQGTGTGSCSSTNALCSSIGEPGPS